MVEFKQLVADNNEWIEHRHGVEGYKRILELASRLDSVEGDERMYMVENATEEEIGDIELLENLAKENAEFNGDPDTFSSFFEILKDWD